MNQILLIIAATAATSGRVLGLMLLSIVTGWFLSYAAVKSQTFENVYIPLIEVLESVPVISFFPVVLSLFVLGIGGPLGVELAADFLVFTAVVWNIWMGEYQAFKTIPREMIEVSDNYRLTFFERMRNVYIPFSVPRIAANLFPSVSDGFFYITVSEVFSVGVHTYQTFGIGTLLNGYVSAGAYSLVWTALGILAVFIAAIVLGLRQFSRYAVAKYTLDTDQPIVRRGRLNVRETLRLSAIASVNPLTKLARYNIFRSQRPVEDDDFDREKRVHNLRYVWASTGFVVLALIVYGSYSEIVRVSARTWSTLIGETPFLLESLAYDYLRVAVISLVSTAIAIFLGYYLAQHSRAEAVGVPLIQTLSAYPAPTYFPFLFLGVYPVVTYFFGPLTDEAFVLFLGFVSTFYYVFYSFWMGVKAMPAEYGEVMRNLNLSYFQRLRYVIIPSTLPYLVSGISSTVNSAWGGLMIGEYWPSIAAGKNLTVSVGLMKVIDVATSNGNIALAAWASLLFGMVVVAYSLLFTKRLLDLARKKYVAEEGIYAA